LDQGISVLDIKTNKSGIGKKKPRLKESSSGGEMWETKLSERENPIQRTGAKGVGRDTTLTPIEKRKSKEKEGGTGFSQTY